MFIELCCTTVVANKMASLEEWDFILVPVTGPPTASQLSSSQTPKDFLLIPAGPLPQLSVLPTPLHTPRHWSRGVGTRCQRENRTTLGSWAGDDFTCLKVTIH